MITRLHKSLESCGEEPAAIGRLLIENNRGHISRIAVLKGFRGHGLGQVIVESLEKLAREKGRHAVYLFLLSYFFIATINYFFDSNCLIRFSC